MFLSQLLTIAGIHLLAVMSPGPDFAMVTRNSLLYTRKSGIYTSLGLALGIMVHVAYCLLGIGLLISQSIILFSIIKYLGAGYLFYIGYMSLRAKPQTAADVRVTVEAEDKHPLHFIRIGFLTNLLNPKATLFFLALFTQVIDPVTPVAIQLVYGLEMVVMTFIWFSIVSIFFSHTKMKEKIKKVQHHVERFTGAVLIALGIKVVVS